MTAAAASARGQDLAMQLSLLMRWWPGRYDNHEQVARQSGGGFAQHVQSPFHRLHTVVQAAARPDLGANVLYVADYELGDESTPVRERLYVLTIDVASDGLRVRRYDLASDVAPAGASDSLDASRLATAALAPLGDLVMRFVGGQFEGAPAAAPGEQEDADVRIVVGTRFQWVRDRPAKGRGQGWFEQTRARMFTCSIHENPDGDMRRTRHLTDVRLHDQGGAVDLDWPDGRTLTFTLHTLAFTSPAEHVSPLFGIHEKGQAVPIAYAYASQGATRFGLNLGWFYVRCYDEDDAGAMAMLALAPPSPPRSIARGVA